ncbi:MAG TPA: hypothetical protein VFR08_06850 [Candidatus Angelobacter sp.]|nr:hypothetical protein [Candidatus Angelobacter sp.]
MPSNVNGFGTKYYGQRDFRADGSYLTTNFFCLGFVPIIPLHSVRVIADPKNSAMPFSKNYYSILEKRWPHPLQVLFIYLWAAAAAGMGILYFWKIEPFLTERFVWLTQGWQKTVVFAVLVAVPVAVGVLLRTLVLKRGQLNSAKTP